MAFICNTSFYKLESDNKTTVSNLFVQQSKYHPFGAVDDPMNCCLRPKSSRVPRGDSFDCCTERYEIVVYCV